MIYIFKNDIITEIFNREIIMIFEKNKILEDLPPLKEYMDKAKSIDYFSNNFLDLNQNIEELQSELRKIKNLQTKLKEYPDILENSFLSLFQSKIKLSYRGRKLIISYPYTKKFEIEYSPFSEKYFSFNIIPPDDFSLLDLFNDVYNNFLKDTQLYKNENTFKSFLDSLKYIELCKEKIKDLVEEYHLNINILRNKDKYNINRIQKTLKKNTLEKEKLFQKINRLLVRPEGVEPSTFWSEARRSIQLSYERLSKLFTVYNIINEKKYI